ncbi:MULTISPECIES: RagB/SusD family nutrient uptake outer membrane protein [unclassified Spirosoma]|uniref:RagB/SusD family nutrient uptake outer membrane protein n=1 Tax=unclassified Spirosoma TaxID=2621999 RepID=UPI00095CA429|nr:MULTISPECIES: RagB/SusD family nutrient uptake outer membrane protein [unclassified Spirosoma]MBN8825689.1 RagB/SusD family nutrient uptake outer membrane protein [Spirosoma sp.]OJW76616.1 MAG: RagB/SusD family nutrient uptake outer membrane protein [Spirosoma sp. 48-14]
MNRPIRFGIICLLALAFVNACKPDFLDRQPLSNITPDNYLVEESQLAAYAINQYSILPTHPQSGFGTFGNDVNTDNMAYMSYTERFVPGQWRVPATGGDWSFTTIYQCNYFLQTVLPRLKAGQIAGNPAMIQHYIGEMYFLRAYNYFVKLMSLGDFPIVKTTLPDDKDVLTVASKRAPQNEVARFILSDLDSAYYYMQANAPDGNRNRLSKPCALIMKSRVALYEGTWLKYFKNTAFVPKGPGWPGEQKEYNKSYTFPAGGIDGEIDYFLTQAMTSAKAVADATPLVANNMAAQTQTTYDAFATATMNNPYFAMFGSVDLKPFSEVLLWRKYDKGLNIGHNVVLYAGGGNYASGLTRGMVDGFLMKNGLPIYDPNSGYAGDDDLQSVRKDRDGRLWLFLKEPGQKNVLITAANPIPFPIEPTPRILEVSFENNYSTGYSIRKGINYDANQVQTYYGGFTGSIVFRATEAYLNYMEAVVEKTGNIDGTAIQYWQQIRNRAGVDPDYQKTIGATNLAKEALNDWGVYSAGSMISPLLYNVRRERRNELMAEGFRYMDLRRWRAMDQLITTPYHIEGFKIWGPMKNWYTASTLVYGIGDKSTVSSPALSQYLRPYEKTPTSLAYNGYKWHMAHYLTPIANQHFLITSQNNNLDTSPIYQNPGWPTAANQGPQ